MNYSGAKVVWWVLANKATQVTDNQSFTKINLKQTFGVLPVETFWSGYKRENRPSHNVSRGTPYRPSRTRSTAKSEALTPEILEAVESVSGCSAESFSRASLLSDSSAW